MMDGDALALYLRQLKAEHNLSVRDIEARSGVPASTVNRILSGRTATPPLETVQRLITAMDGDLAVLAEAADDVPPEHPADEQEGGQRGAEDMRSVYQQSLQRMEDNYRSSLANITDAMETTIRLLRYERTVATVVALVLLLVLVMQWAVDWLVPTIGWIRR